MQSIRHAAFLWLGFLFFPAAYGQQVVDLLDQPIRVQPVKYVLWEISGPRLRQPSYLYGILYKVPANAFYMVPGLTPVVGKVDRLVMEVHPADTDRDHLYRGTVPMDSTLEELLPRRDYVALSDFVRDSLSAVSLLKLMRRYQPLLLSRQFMCDFCLGFNEQDPPINYEQYLFQVTHLPLTPLSNGWARDADLEMYSFQEQTDLLMNTLRNKRPLCLNYQELLKAYWRQDLESVWALSQSVPDFGNNTATLVDARNAEWMELLPTMMERERVLIAVHAVHLPGEYGLIHQLRKAGYEVRPVVQ